MTQSNNEPNESRKPRNGNVNHGATPKRRPIPASSCPTSSVTRTNHMHNRFLIGIRSCEGIATDTVLKIDDL